MTLPSSMRTREDLARLFGVSTQAISDWIDAKSLPEPLRIGRRPFWSREQIVRVLETKGAAK